MKKIISASLAVSYLIAAAVILLIAMVSIFGQIQENSIQSQDNITASLLQY